MDLNYKTNIIKYTTTLSAPNNFESNFQLLTDLILQIEIAPPNKLEDHLSKIIELLTEFNEDSFSFNDSNSRPCLYLSQFLLSHGEIVLQHLPIFMFFLRLFTFTTKNFSQYFFVQFEDTLPFFNILGSLESQFFQSTDAELRVSILDFFSNVFKDSSLLIQAEILSHFNFDEFLGRYRNFFQSKEIEPSEINSFFGFLTTISNCDINQNRSEIFSSLDQNEKQQRLQNEFLLGRKIFETLAPFIEFFPCEIIKILAHCLKTFNFRSTEQNFIEIIHKYTFSIENVEVATEALLLIALYHRKGFHIFQGDINFLLKLSVLGNPSNPNDDKYKFIAATAIHRICTSDRNFLSQLNMTVIFAVFDYSPLKCKFKYGLLIQNYFMHMSCEHLIPLIQSQTIQKQSAIIDDDIFSMITRNNQLEIPGLFLICNSMLSLEIELLTIAAMKAIRYLFCKIPMSNFEAMPMIKETFCFYFPEDTFPMHIDCTDSSIIAERESLRKQVPFFRDLFDSYVFLTNE